MSSNSSLLGLSLFSSITFSLYFLQKYYSSPTSTPEICGLYLYPIKSCGGIEVSSITTSKFGIKGDRICLISDGENKMVTQRKLKNLDYIFPSLNEDLTSMTLSLNKERVKNEIYKNFNANNLENEEIKDDKEILPSFNLEDSLQKLESFQSIQLNLIQNENLPLTTIKIKVWDDELDSFQLQPADKISSWLNEALLLTLSPSQRKDEELIEYIKSFKILKFLENTKRRVDENYIPVNKIRREYEEKITRGELAENKEKEPIEVLSLYTDDYPLLICSKPSIDKLQDKLIEKYGKEREEEIREKCTVYNFRPNILIDNCEEFEEDSWNLIEFHQTSPASSTSNVLKAEICKPCARCPMINKKFSFTSTVEPTETLKSYRTGKSLLYKKEKWHKDVFFGQNLHHFAVDGFLLSVGDKIKVKSYRRNFW